MSVSSTNYGPMVPEPYAKGPFGSRRNDQPLAFEKPLAHQARRTVVPPGQNQAQPLTRYGRGIIADSETTLSSQ
jgi:hypothetical protein